MGVDLTYECINNCTIRVYLRAYRDCSGATTITNTINFTSQTTGCGAPTAVTGWSPQFTQEVTPLCPGFQTQCTNPQAQLNGVQEYFWFRDYDICGQPNCIFTITWGTCCRNGAINSGSANQGLGIAATTINTNIQPCNSSPQFLNPPVPYLCAGQTYVFNQGAVDPEGDSLAYSIGPCSTDANQPVSYNGGFSATQPLGPSWNVQINSATGDITVTPQPGNTVVGVMCVYVEEWRNGTLINTIVRDIQMTAINCPANTQPLVNNITNVIGATPAGGYVVTTCAGNNICFDLPVFDPDSATQSLTIWWDQSLPGGQFTQTGGPGVDSFSVAAGNSLSATFCWTPPGIGTYPFLVTVQDDACPIIGQAQFTVQIVVTDLEATVSAVNPGCGTVELCADSVSGSPPYTYVWTGTGGLSSNPNATDSCVTHQYPGTGTYDYFLQITDANGCVGFDTGQVSVLVNVEAIAGPDVSFCSGGSAQLGSPGLPGETYQWLTPTGLSSTTSPQPTVTLTNATTTTQVIPYILETTDLATTCTDQDTVLVTVFPIPSAAFNLPAATCLNDQVAISYTGFSDPGATYNWTFNGGTPATASGQGPHNVSWATTGAQTVTLTVTENGCVSPLGSQTITVNPLPTSTFTASGPHCVNTPATLTYTGSASPTATYTWNFGGGTVVSGSGGGPYQVSWPTSGTQTVTLVVTENSCTGSQSSVPVTITDPGTASAALDDANCFGFSDGSVDLTVANGTPNFGYAWSGPGGYTANTEDINGLFAGTYVVTITDGAGCISTFNAVIDEPVLLTAVASSTPATCNGGSDGTATVVASGGTLGTGYSYQWDQAANNQVTQTATGLAAGTYGVTVTDVQGCVATTTVQVAQPSQVAVSLSATDVSCNGGNDGTVTAVGSGGVSGFTYSWTPGNLAGATISGIAQLYTVVATDANGCSVSDTISIVEPSPLTATTQTTPSTCALTTDNGTASVFASDGNGGYTYLWGDINNQVTQQALNLAPGTYSVTVTDQLGCTFVTSAVVGEILPPSVAAGPSVSFCEGEGGAEVFATPTGGTPGYYYSWWCNIANCGIDSLNDNDPLMNPTVSTWYYVQVSDTNGCLSNVDSVWVEVLPKPIVDAGPDQYICGDSAPCVILNPVISGTAGPYSYMWSPANGLNDPTLLNPCARPDTTTIYTLVVTGGNGCTSDFTTTDTLSSVTVHVNPIPVAEAGPDRDICLGDSVELQGFATGAGPNYTFEWSPLTGLSDPTVQNPMASPAIYTEYVLVAYSNNCPSYGDTVVVDVHTLPTVNAGPSQDICLGGSTLLDAQGGGDLGSNYSFLWSPAASLDDETLEDPTATPDTTTTYSVVSVSEWGCESDPATTLVTVLSTPVVEAGENVSFCTGNEIQLDGSFMYTTTLPANPNDEFIVWTPNQDIDDNTILDPTVSPANSGYYYMTVSTGICSGYDSVFVEVFPEINLAVSADTGVACEGTPVQLSTAGGLGGTLYSWFPTDGLDDPTAQNPIAAPSETTTYTVIGAEGICADTQEVTIEVIPAPVPAYLSSLREGCAPHAVSFLQNATDGVNYVWNFGDNTPVSNEDQPSHVYEAPGSYNVSLTVVNSGGCETTVNDLLIRVMEPPIADFSTIEAFPLEMALPNSTVEFNNESTSGMNYTWDFGDGNQTKDENPSHTFTQPGTYMVSLMVTNEIGCSERVMHGPFVVLTPELFIPNVFSPNSDAINDIFLVEYTGSQPFNLQIFDRWGVKLYEGNNKNEGWDGRTLEGGEAMTGTYFYRLKVGEKEFAGDVTLAK